MVSVTNSQVPGNSLLVSFKRLSFAPKGLYWIRWGIETAEGYQCFETPYVMLGRFNSFNSFSEVQLYHIDF